MPHVKMDSTDSCGSDENSLARPKSSLTMFLFLGFLLPSITAGSALDDDGDAWWPKRHAYGTPVPEFQGSGTRVVVGAGDDVFLPCRISNAKDKLVSWIRSKDLHILTSGTVTFTADDRFKCENKPTSMDWALRLRNAQPRDAGEYECQVNTDPKMSRKITLDVVSGFQRDPFFRGSTASSTSAIHSNMVDDEAVFARKGDAWTKVLGKKEQFVKAGSTITFTCVVGSPGQAVSSIEWLKDGRQVSLQASRGGIIVDTEKSKEKATSRLTLANVQLEDIGNYTCKPGNGNSNSVLLVVVSEKEERPEAMKNKENSGKTLHNSWNCFLTVFFIFLLENT